jgi:hypothetical protein
MGRDLEREGARIDFGGGEIEPTTKLRGQRTICSVCFGGEDGWARDLIFQWGFIKWRLDSKFVRRCVGEGTADFI